MKAAAPVAALLWIAMAAQMAVQAAAQTAPQPATTPTGAAASPAAPAVAAPGQPKILNPSPPAASEITRATPAPVAEPYAGQKPPSAPAPAATPPAPAATQPAAAATPAPPAPVPAKPPSAAAEAKPAASSPAPAAVPEGPAVQPIAKPGEKTTTSAPEPATTTAATPTVAPAPKPEPPKPTLLVSIDLTNQTLSVSDNGAAKYKWNISSGRTGYLTPKGTFRPIWMSKMWYSRKYDYAPMPHAIFFHGGTAIHGTDALGSLGRPASHGCVRLSPGNAATLYKLVNQHGKQKTRITVFGTPKQPRVAARDDGYYPSSRSRRYRDTPSWYDDEDMPPPPRSRRMYSDRYYDAPPRAYYPRRPRRYVRDYDVYDDF